MRNATIRPALLAKRLAEKRRAVAVATALLVVAGTTGVALAASPYTVKLTVPSTPSSSTFKVKATGSAASPSQVVAYIGNKACASRPGLEAAQPARRVINKSVNHTYMATKTAQTGSAGSHRVCAYLTAANGSTVRAHASASYTYTVLTGGY